MRRQKIAVAAIAMGAVLFGLSPGVWASGSNVPPGCLVESPTGGPEMSGSVAFKATLTSPDSNLYTVDVTLDLKFRNKHTETGSFVTGQLLAFSFILSPEGVACAMLNGLRSDILSAFGLPATKQLKICFSTNTTDRSNCQSISRFEFDLGGTNLGLAIIDRIFVVD